MGYQRSIFDNCRDSLILLVTLALSTVCIAEPYELMVAYAEGPSADEYVAGNLDTAIDLLESKEKMADNQLLGEELATLCGFYILKGNLDAARETCSAAVETNQTGLAYNNRGVFRAQRGDTVGALEDFDRVRVLPDDQPLYIELLKEADPRLIASRNFALATEIMERRGTNKPTMTGVVDGANIEEINH